MIRNILIISILLFAAAVVLPSGAGADESEELWMEFCLSCHGAHGQGDGPAAISLDAKPANLADCDAMAKRSDEHLANVISKGGSANELSDEMASYGDRLEEDEIKALVGYVRGFCK